MCWFVTRILLFSFFFVCCRRKFYVKECTINRTLSLSLSAPPHRGTNKSSAPHSSPPPKKNQNNCSSSQSRGNKIKTREIQPGGSCFIFLPFLFCFHFPLPSQEYIYIYIVYKHNDNNKIPSSPPFYKLSFDCCFQASTHSRYRSTVGAHFTPHAR